MSVRGKKPKTTEVKYAELPASPQLDDYVHQLVMNHAYSPTDQVPRYSSDPVAALEVVRKMKEGGFSFNLHESEHGATVSFVCSRGPCPKHGTTFHNHHGSYDIQGPTMALATCRAALVAQFGGR